MKVMFCIPTLGGGGAEGQVAGLAAWAKKLGHEVHVVFTRGGVNLERRKASGAPDFSDGVTFRRVLG